MLVWIKLALYYLIIILYILYIYIHLYHGTPRHWMYIFLSNGKDTGLSVALLISVLIMFLTKAIVSLTIP